jgi:2-polyprenyl-3-methyl-5-hydroxy-6-metoxy-1,4-benzoquinol methylase
MLKPTGSTERIQDVISELVRGKTVLDVGCVQHNADNQGSDTWLHRHLVRSAASVPGVDIIQTEVARLTDRGDKVSCADAVSLDLDEAFDVITAGEIIEHLDEPGAFLRNMHKHLRDEEYSC